MTNMHVRDVPDELHRELQRRAAAAGMTLRAYTVQVLADHCASSSVADWQERLARRRVRWLAEGRAMPVTTAANAVDAGRDDSWAVDEHPA